MIATYQLALLLVEHECFGRAVPNAFGVRRLANDDDGHVGPFDGHNVEEMEHALQNAIELSDEGPILVHVLTQKGRGYGPAEEELRKALAELIGRE